MLAYVFAHRPAAGVDAGAYEKTLRAFHAELASARPAGFVASTTYRFDDGGYSDWYLVESSAALDVLNQAAVTGPRAESHDMAARMAGGGSGKLMSLAAGEADLGALYETGFAKPRGRSYADLYASLHPLTSRPGVALWRRMMVLGPPPEFCLVSRAPVELPAELAPEPSVRRQI
ncbi:MAG TPA: hypothetical protein VFL29_08740 [Candidatus Dormibacteraeota bacterium]|nr:hypothetical protein [Candidatus Dormibacteraeota bacterium]